MSSLMFPLSFIYIHCWWEIPPSKFSSAIPFYIISFQNPQRPSIYFPFLITAKASRQEVIYASDSFASVFSEPWWRCRYLEKNKHLNWEILQKSSYNTLLDKRWQIKIKLAWRDCYKTHFTPWSRECKSIFKVSLISLAHKPWISFSFR